MRTIFNVKRYRLYPKKNSTQITLPDPLQQQQQNKHTAIMKCAFKKKLNKPEDKLINKISIFD